MREKAKLTPKQKKEIWEVICSNSCQDDTDPQEVIARDYGGSEDEYLLAMAKWHKVLLD